MPQAIADASALFGATRRYAFVALQNEGLCRFFYTGQILRELRNNLPRAHRRRRLREGLGYDAAIRMAANDANARVNKLLSQTRATSLIAEPFAHLQEQQPVNQKDQHLLAAAMTTGTHQIVTLDERLINEIERARRNEQTSVEGITPGDFLALAFNFDSSPTARVLAAISEHHSGQPVSRQSVQRILDRLGAGELVDKICETLELP